MRRTARRRRRRARRRAVDVVGDDRLTDALPYLQRAALPAGARRRRSSSAPELLDELRDDGAARLGVEAPELAKLTRVSVTTLVLAIGTLIGGWALIGVLLNVANSFSTDPWREPAVGRASSRSSRRSATRSSALSCEGSIPGTLPVPEARRARAVEHLLGARRRHRGGPRRARPVLPEAGPGRDDGGELGRACLDRELDREGRPVPHRAALRVELVPLRDGRGGHARATSKAIIAHALRDLRRRHRARRRAVRPEDPRRSLKKKLAPKATEMKAHLATLAQHPIKLVEVFGGCIVGQLLVAVRAWRVAARLRGAPLDRRSSSSCSPLARCSAASRRCPAAWASSRRG